MAVALAGYLGGLAAVAAIPLAAGVLLAISRRPHFRARIQSAAFRRAQLERSADRDARIAMAPVERNAQYTRLRQLADEIESAPNEEVATAADMEGLLDHFVESAVALERCRRAIGRTEALVARPLSESSSPKEVLLAEIIERRIQHREVSRRRAAVLEVDLDAISETIELLAQQLEDLASLSPPEADARAIIERRLLEIDCHEDAACELT